MVRSKTSVMQLSHAQSNENIKEPQPLYKPLTLNTPSCDTKKVSSSIMLKGEAKRNPHRWFLRVRQTCLSHMYLL